MRAASRIALRPFSGSTPACAARPWTVDPQVQDALARGDDVAVGARALEDEARVGVRGERPDVRRRGRRADLLVGVGDEHEPLERQRRRARPSERLERVQPGQQPGLHVGHARAVGDPVRRSRNGRSAAVPGRTPCPCGRSAGRAARPAGRRTCATTVSPSRPAGSGRRSTSAPRSVEERGDPAADLVDAVGRVAAAVDVDEPREVGEEGGQVGLDRRRGARRARRSRRRRSGGVGRGGPSAASLGARWRAVAILPGPCD